MKNSQTQSLTINELHKQLVEERDTLRSDVARLTHQNNIYVDELTRTAKLASDKQSLI